LRKKEKRAQRPSRREKVASHKKKKTRKGSPKSERERGEKKGLLDVLEGPFHSNHQEEKKKLEGGGKEEEDTFPVTGWRERAPVRPFEKKKKMKFAELGKKKGKKRKKNMGFEQPRDRGERGGTEPLHGALQGGGKKKKK